MLDFELDDIKDWPFNYQLVIGLLVFMSSSYAWFWFSAKSYSDELERAMQLEQRLKLELKTVVAQTANLPNKKQQLELVRSRYQRLLHLLPVQQELATLLAGVNQEGLHNQLTFTRIDWGKRASEHFLYKLPINIELTGNYNDIGHFSQAIAELSRMVLIEDAEWQRVSQESSVLHFRVQAATYQLHDDFGEKGDAGKN
ncbi:type 4a pilus biogenesis protein PilO [Vibrio mediterranei]|uniref:type 4a pilus biogenesis protein PilO n=1 Tax=Vibrio mediterranei TaxID=689 RepID=UPI00148D3311|nr:type 4a pilus biogenesis protein PilO [Vibrio mediterranei]NOH30517.1 type 4a pilus biogenesis protein PilO [Vibrio mediterranei]